MRILEIGTPPKPQGAYTTAELTAILNEKTTGATPLAHDGCSWGLVALTFGCVWPDFFVPSRHNPVPETFESTGTFTAVPEPVSVLLVGSGIIAAARRRWRCQRDGGAVVLR